MRFTAIDLETTGLAPYRDRIIEIGAVKYENGIAKDVFSTLVHPQITELPERIVALTGITEEMLSDAPEEEEAMRALFSFLEGEEVLLGHNVIFDYAFLKVAAKRLGREFSYRGLDTLAISRVCHPELSSKTLAAMCEAYHIVNEHAHRAYEDAEAAAKLFFCLKERFAKKDYPCMNPSPLVYKEKKTEPITKRQCLYLQGIIERNGLSLAPDYATLTKSEASRLIDKLLVKYGRE